MRIETDELTRVLAAVNEFSLAEAVERAEREVRGEGDAFRRLRRGKREVRRFKRGQVVTYEYAAKNGERLPIWDQRPLVLVLDPGQSNGNMLGLNLHYMEPADRAAFIGGLVRRLVGRVPRPRHDTQLPVRYEDLPKQMLNTARGRLVRSYSPERILGRVTRVQPHEWPHAVVLPTEAWEERA